VLGSLCWLDVASPSFAGGWASEEVLSGFFIAARPRTLPAVVHQRMPWSGPFKGGELMVLLSVLLKGALCRLWLRLLCPGLVEMSGVHTRRHERCGRNSHINLAPVAFYRARGTILNLLQ